MADAIKTLGSVLYMSTEAGSPQNFVTVGNVTDFTKGGERNIIGTSNLGSTAATKMSGLLDEGDFTFQINWDPALSAHQSVIAALDDGAVREFKLVLTDSSNAEIHFNGIVKSFPVSGPFDSKVTVNVGVAISGKAWLAY